MKIGILGGTFNPPHYGHLILAQEVLQKLKLDRVLFIPANLPPHKNATLVSAAHRHAMVERSIKGNKKFSLCDVEIRRGGTSYTIDTVLELKKKFPGKELYLIVGSDLARTFHAWKERERLSVLSRIVVARRREFPLRKKNNFIAVDILHIGISSSLIRELVKEKKSIRYLVPLEVEKYIKRYKLYR